MARPKTTAPALSFEEGTHSRILRMQHHAAGHRKLKDSLWKVSCAGEGKAFLLSGATGSIRIRMMLGAQHG
jgi:hypothetical protein